MDCVICSAPVKSGSKYCSDRCRQKAYRQRHKSPQSASTTAPLTDGRKADLMVLKAKLEAAMDEATPATLPKLASEYRATLTELAQPTNNQSEATMPADVLAEIQQRYTQWLNGVKGAEMPEYKELRSIGTDPTQAIMQRRALRADALEELRKNWSSPLN